MEGRPPERNPDAGVDEPSSLPSSEADLEQFRVRLTLFAARRTRNWADAEDITQETLRRGLEALRSNRLRDVGALPAFLFATAVHVCQQRDRSAGRANRALRRLGAAAEDVAEDSLTTLITEERLSRIREGLEQLDRDDREVLTLTYGSGLRAEDIARRLATTAGNVRVRRHRALKRLNDLLGVTPGPNREP